jgi:hypothetical protein
MGLSTANAALVLVVCNENRGGSERKGPRDQRRIFVRYAAAMPSQSRGDRDVKITVGMSDSERVECDLQPCMMNQQRLCFLVV